MSTLKYEIGFDHITGERKIQWSHYLIHRKIYSMNKGWEIHLDFNIKDDKPCLHFRFRGIKLRAKDKIYIGATLSYVELTVLKPPHRFDDELKEVDFLLSDEDLLHIKNTGIASLHIRYNNGDAPFDADYIFFSSIQYKLSVNDILSGKGNCEEECIFDNYFELYLKALKEVRKDEYLHQKLADEYLHQKFSDKYLRQLLGIRNKHLEATHICADLQQENRYDYCYVYLMHDKRNGYHKIGMSNKPEVREKTLQSEVPAIEMVCSKKYPSRKIAKAIEAALHNVYAEQRVRGEWFNLSLLDIQMLKETLS